LATLKLRDVGDGVHHHLASGRRGVELFAQAQKFAAMRGISSHMSRSL
jgi:uncharacterized protein YebE (UPF0316 family)